MKQLEHIGYYMKDFSAVLESFKPPKAAGKHIETVLEDSEDDR